MYQDDYDEIDGLGRFHKKLTKRFKKITKKLNPVKVFKKVTRKVGPVSAFKKITRKVGPVRMLKRGLKFSKRVNKKLNPVAAFRSKWGAGGVFKRVTRKVGPKAMYNAKWGAGGIMKRFGPTKILKKTGGMFKTSTPRGKFRRNAVIIGGTAAAAAAAALYARNREKTAKMETSLLTESATSPLTKKVGATPLSKSVVVNVSNPGGGGGMFRTAQPRDSGGNVIRGKNDMIKKAAMIGIPAVLGVGALYMLMRKK